MIGYVAKVRLHLFVDQHQLAVLKTVAYFDQRTGRIAQTQQIAAKHVQALDIGVTERGATGSRTPV
jgi:hypothetical protein